MTPRVARIRREARSFQRQQNLPSASPGVVVRGARWASSSNRRPTGRFHQVLVERTDR
jgi:hypothetical protein